MRFDFGLLAAKLESASPRLAKTVSIRLLNLVSPFNSHLRASLIEWTPQKAQLAVKNHRGVKNHLGGIHAGALFTLGETCAGFVILKNFSFREYRPIMSEISVVFHKQARGKVCGVCKINKSDLTKTRSALKSGKAHFMNMTTEITNENGEKIADVKTRWQVKPWSLIKS